jgi:hypothetical protein
MAAIAAFKPATPAGPSTASLKRLPRQHTTCVAPTRAEQLRARESERSSELTAKASGAPSEHSLLSAPSRSKAVEIDLTQVERIADPQARTAECHDEAAPPKAVSVIAALRSERLLRRVVDSYTEKRFRDEVWILGAEKRDARGLRRVASLICVADELG